MEIDQQFVDTRAQDLRYRLTLRSAYDLVVISGLAALQLVLLVAPLTWLRVPLGLVLSLFAPGYALTAVLFPRRLNHDSLIRVALSVGLSAALLPPLAWLLDNLPWGIRPWAVTLSLSLLIIVLSIVALWQRWSLASASAPSPQTYLPPNIELAKLRHTLGQHNKTTFVIGAAAIAAAGLLMIALLAPSSATRMTEFYILGRDKLAEGYPRTVAVGEELTLTMGIVNREAASHTYRVEVWAANGLNRDQRILLVKKGSITLLPGQRTQGPVLLRMPWTGNEQTIEFLLFVDDKSEPYRQLRLWINVAESVAAS